MSLESVEIESSLIQNPFSAQMSTDVLDGMQPMPIYTVDCKGKVQIHANGVGVVKVT